MTTQSELQTALNDALNAVIRDFLPCDDRASWPTAETIGNALDDAKSDAPAILTKAQNAADNYAETVATSITYDDALGAKCDREASLLRTLTAAGRA